MVRSLTRIVLLLAALTLSGCTVVLPLAEQALTPQPLAVRATMDTANLAAATLPVMATATMRPAVGPTEPDLEALELPNDQLRALGAALFQRGPEFDDWLAGIVGAGPITLLAPSDRAFAAVDPANLERLLGDGESLQRFVGAHVIRGIVSLDDLVSAPAETVSGNMVAAAPDGDGFTVEGLPVLQRDVVMPFGALHVIDGILPASGLEPDAMGTLAPTHTPAQRPTSTATSTPRPTQTATPTTTAAATATPTATPTTAATLASTATPRATATFAATATAARAVDLQSLVESIAGVSRMAELLRLAELDGLLRETSGLTLLAPTDDAFAELSEAEFGRLTGDPGQLLAWLERHLIPQRFTAAELGQMATVDALSGEPLEIRNRLGRLIIDGARVLDRDIRATNGFVHTTDTVVLP